MKYQNIQIRKCIPTDLSTILNLQETIFQGLDNPSILRRNTKEIFAQCLEESNCTIGVYDGEKMAGVIILVEPSGGETDLRKNLKCHTVENAADFKLVMIRKEYRGLGLQHSLMWVLEKIAYQKGYKYLCVSVSPDNPYSRRNIINSGYEFDHQEVLYGGLEREVYVKKLEVDNYNKKITDFAKGSSKKICLIPELANYFNGTSDIATTGDIMEYQDKITGKSCFGLCIDERAPLIFHCNEKSQKWEPVRDASYIEQLVLKNVWINSSAEYFPFNAVDDCEL